jgi:hypothetical protein
MLTRCDPLQLTPEENGCPALELVDDQRGLRGINRCCCVQHAGNDRRALARVICHQPMQMIGRAGYSTLDPGAPIDLAAIHACSPVSK